MEEVAVYLTVFGKLPGNFIRKNAAQDLGWNNRDGNLDEVAPGCSIGGDRFGNYEGQLPDAKNRKWTECDIDYDPAYGYRGAKRIVFSNDGLIYYTDDHYETFSLVEVIMEENAGKTEEKQSKDKKEKKESKDAKKEDEEIIQGVREDYQEVAEIDEYGEYTTAEEVAYYLYIMGQLPLNYLTKTEAEELGFSSQKDNLEEIMPGCAIGGDSFGNREKLLPDAEGREWFQCDVNIDNGKRGSERLVYSSDGLIYYSPDNFESFIQLY
jgi:guanyl-specific ribonuclease Sa